VIRPGCHISFIVIAKNEEYALPKCLESIVRLDLQGYEVICVDSGSSDGTQSIMLEYAASYGTFRYVSAPNCRNAAMARNRGIEVAHGRLVFFVDGDIELNRQFVQLALEILENSSASAVAGGLDEVIYDNCTKSDVRGPYQRSHYTKCKDLMACSGTFVVSASVVHDIGLYDERFYVNQDIDYSLRLSSAHRLVGIPMQMGIHYTQEYGSRPWLHLISGIVMNQGLLARKHFMRRGFLRYWYSSRKISVWGLVLTNTLLLLVVLHILGGFSWAPPTMMLAMMLTCTLAYSVHRQQSFLTTLILVFLNPYLIVLGFLGASRIGRCGPKRAEKH